MNQHTVNTAAAEFHATAASIENWMLDAEGEHDAHLTAQAIASAATEALQDGAAVLAHFANGYDLNVGTVRAYCSALRNVLAWTRTVQA